MIRKFLINLASPRPVDINLPFKATDPAANLYSQDLPGCLYAAGLCGIRLRKSGIGKGRTPLYRFCQRVTLRTYPGRDRKSTRLNSSHVAISYAVFCLKKKKQTDNYR